MAKFGFDVNETEAFEGTFDPIPEGEYVLQAVDAEEKTTKAGTGNYINVKYEVLKGEYTGRLIWHMFNVNNPNETAQRIGRGQLVAWATACGKPDADDTDKLIGKPFTAEVMIAPGQNGYAASNRIKLFLFDHDKQEESKPVAKSAPKASAKPAKTAGKATANPWD